MLSHGSQILSGAGLFEVANRAASELVTGEYNPVDTNSPLFRPSDYTNIVRQKTEEEIEDKAKGPAGKGLGMLYSGATSTIDSLLGAGAFGQAGALGVMGVGAAANSTKSTFERTADTKKSAITGAAAGIIEVATEKMGLDNLWDIVRGSGKAAARNAFVNFAVQSGIEGTEEITSEIANTVVDGIVNGGMSEYMTNIRKYMSEGYSEEEATKLAEREFALQCAESFAVGTISGGISGGIGAGAERLQTGMFGQSAMDSGTIEDVAQRAESYDDYYVQKALNNYKAKQSPYAAGKLMNEVARAEENPEQLILKSTTVEENPVDKVKNAESIEDMVEAVKEAELNGTPEEVEMVKGAYEYQKAKLMSSGAVTTEQVIAAENNLTQTEAYQLGRTGQQAEPERLSEKSMAAYQRGVQEYQAERETIYNREDGALNARTEEGKQFEVKGIKTIENEPVLETDSGDVKLSEVQFENEATQMLFNNASTQKSDEAAKVYVECYPAGVTVSSYNRQFDRFLTAGRLGVPFHNLTKENTPMKQMIGVVNLAKIYNAGRDMEQEQRKRETSANVKKKGKER